MEDGEALPRFKAVLSQLREDQIPAFASSIRLLKSSVSIPCKRVVGPIHGSFNIAYRIAFEDGLQWLLKIPHNGHRKGWNEVAAKGLRTEFHTMKMIKNRTSIPIPAVHDFDDNLDNDIGCPFMMMDFIEGEPLYKVWFNKEQGPLKLDMIRARALQTLASAMVQLTKFKVTSGGALEFDKNGKPTGVGSAKIVDMVAMMEEPYSEENPDPLCEKGPSSDPLSFSMFTPDQYLSRYTASVQERGTLQMLRICMEGVLKASHLDGKQFCLTHPDLDTQNIIVKEDGTLCGLIDWDGALAVPNAIGPLSYPKFLIRDWNPYFYKRDLDRRIEMEPEELERYRVMYAQFVEMAKGREAANVTRASVIAANLDAAANNFNLLDGLLGKIFENVTNMTEVTSKDIESLPKQRNLFEESGAEDCDRVSDETGGDDKIKKEVSEGEEDDEDVEEEDNTEEEEVSQGNTDTPQTDTDDSVDTSKSIFVEGSHCRNCGAAETLDSDAPGQTDATKPPLEQALRQSPQRSATSAPEKKLFEQRLTSRSRIASSVLAVASEGCKFAASKLHRNTLSEVDEERPTSKYEAATSREKSVEGSNEDELKGSLNQLATDLREMAHGLHNEHIEIAGTEVKVEAEAHDANLISRQNDIQTPPPQLAVSELQHPQGCPKAKQNIVRVAKSKDKEESHPAGPTIKDAWERIALEVKNCGIRDATIKVHQPKIAGLIIDAMRAEQRRMDDLEEAEKTAKRKAERKAKNELKSRQAQQALKVLEAQEAVDAIGAEQKQMDDLVEVERRPKHDLKRKAKKDLKTPQPQQVMKVPEMQEEVDAISTDNKELEHPGVEGDGPSSAGSLVVHSSEETTSETTRRGLPVDKSLNKRGHSEKGIENPTDGATLKNTMARRPILKIREHPRITQHTQVDLVDPDEQAAVTSEVTSERPGQDDTVQKLSWEPATAETDAATIGSDVSQDRMRPEAALSTQRTKTATVTSSSHVQTQVLGSNGNSISRNHPCPCGSKRKFKKCCGRETKSSAAESVEHEGSHTDQTEFGHNGEKSLQTSSSAESIPAPPKDEYLKYLREREVSHPISPSPMSEHTALHHTEVSDEEEEDEDGIDTGGFTLEDVCVALGEGELDVMRHGRLEEGFKGLLDGLMGRE